MEELNLSGCQLRDIGGVIVAKAIRNNDTLIVGVFIDYTCILSKCFSLRN